MKKYKVWIQVEAVDDDNEIYENISEPECIGAFESEAEAFTLFNKLAVSVGYTATGFGVSDIIEHAEADGYTITREDAEAILDSYSGKIDDVAIERGNDYITDNISQWIAEL